MLVGATPRAVWYATGHREIGSEMAELLGRPSDGRSSRDRDANSNETPRGAEGRTEARGTAAASVCGGRRALTGGRGV